MATDNPLTKSLAVARQEPAVTMMRDCIGGTRAIREKAEEYLPQNKRESDQAYQRRVATSVYHNNVAVTLEGISGMIFRKPVKLGDDVLPDVRGADAHGTGGWWEDIDLAGSHGNVFCRDWFEAGFLEGHAICFVDQPPPVAEGASRADEREIRPFWVMVPKSSIVRAESMRVRGRTVLSRLAWREEEVVPDGAYGQKAVVRVREYRLVAAGEGTGVFYELRQKPEEGDVWPIIESGLLMVDAATPYPEIPAAVFYTKRTGFLESVPPLEALAYENIRHYQICSDNDTVEHVAKVPIFTVAGVTDEEFGSAAVGPNNVWRFDRADTKVGVVQADATPAQIGRETERESEKRMAIHGLSLLRRDDVRVQTATQTALERSEQDARVTNAVDRFKDAVETALGFTAVWLGQEKDAGGSVEVNQDFVDQLLTPEEMRAWSEAVERGQYSVETMWEAFRAGGRLPETFDPEEERRRLASEGMGLLPSGDEGAFDDEEQDEAA